MVAPVRGPFYKVREEGNPPTYYKHQEIWLQGAPFDRPLPYSSVIRKVSGPAGVSVHQYAPPDVGSDLLHASNAAYGRLKSKVSDRAELGAGLAEISDSYSMIRTRATQMFQVARDIKKGRFGDAADKLGLTRTPKGVSRKKQFAGNFLEYSFGWAPLIGDIGSAVNVLQNPIASPTPKGSASVPVRRTLARESWTRTPPGMIKYQRNASLSGSVTCKQGAMIRVANPNLWLANQMGFVNPLSVAWELVPFSFVVDWFTNVGEVVSSMSDFVGLEVENPWTLKLSDLTYEDSWTAVSQYGSWNTVGQYVWDDPTTQTETVRVHFIEMARGLGLTQPQLETPSFSGFGARQAALSLALVTQIFGK